MRVLPTTRMNGNREIREGVPTRRILSKIAAKEPQSLIDTSTLADYLMDHRADK